MSIETKIEPVPDQQPVPVRVMGALSCPRLGFTDPLFMALQLVKMNIDLRKHSGAFWEQSLSQLLYAAVDENYDFVLTMDYDTVFRPADVFYMLQLIVNQPDAAAVFPVQYRRESKELLIGLEGCDDGKSTVSRFEGHLVPATIGHFGLTLIRVAALKTLPHPWLHSQPSPEGRWDADRVDADIGFWNKLRGHGHKFYCASRVVVGHMQQMITWPSDNYQQVHQFMGAYFADGDAPPAVIAAAAARAKEEERQ